MAQEPQLNAKLGAHDQTPYDLVGGGETCRALSNLFHERIAADTLLRSLFPKNLERTTERLAWFVAERLGGPREYTAQRGKTSLRCRHAHVAIGTAESDRWLAHMFEAIDSVGIVDPTRESLRDYFSQMARYLADSLLTLYDLPLDELRTILQRDRALATASDMGRSLLSNAAGRWDATRVQILLEHGANANAVGPLGHGPLYQTTRSRASRSGQDGCTVVALLLKHGAHVNRRSGPGRSTALHMAARRGHVDIADLLLDAGAELEARDSKGETPLRRAVNCGQKAMVELLVSRGADASSEDDRGRTVRSAARTEQIRKALVRRKI